MRLILPEAPALIYRPRSTHSWCHLFNMQPRSGASDAASHMFFLSVGKNWDFTAALSDFEQLRQVHAGTLTYSSAADRAYPPPDREMARVGRPILHRQSEVVQGELLPSSSFCSSYSISQMANYFHLWVRLNRFNLLRASFLQLPLRNVCPGASPTPAQPSCPWPVLTSPTPGVPATSLFWTCPSALSNCPTSPCTGTTSAASSRRTWSSSPWWWLWSTPVRTSPSWCRGVYSAHTFTMAAAKIKVVEC